MFSYFLTEDVVGSSLLLVSFILVFLLIFLLIAIVLILELRTDHPGEALLNEGPSVAGHVANHSSAEDPSHPGKAVSNPRPGLSSPANDVVVVVRLGGREVVSAGVFVLVGPVGRSLHHRDHDAVGSVLGAIGGGLILGWNVDGNIIGEDGSWDVVNHHDVVYVV